MSERYSRMAETADMLEDMRQAQEERARTGQWAPLEIMALVEQGVSLSLADVMAWDGCEGQPLEERAEAAAFAYLVEQFRIEADDKQALAMARKQAKYARKLKVKLAYLERNLWRNLDRRDARKARARLQKVGVMHRHGRPHHTLGVFTPEQRRQAQYEWEHGSTGGLSFHEALCVRSRENGAAYRRMHRILRKLRVNEGG